MACRLLYLLVLHDGRGEVTNGSLCVVEHGDLTSSDVLDGDLPVPEPIDLAQRLVRRGRAEDPAPDAAGVAAAEPEERASRPAVAELGLEAGLGADDADVAGPVDAGGREEADHQVRAAHDVRLAVAGQAELPRAAHRGLHAGPVEPRRRALAPHEADVAARVRRVQRRHGRAVRDLLQQDVEGGAAGGGGDVVGLAEHRVVGREAEDGRPRRGDAPCHHGGEAFEAVGATRAPAKEVVADAVHPLSV